MAKPASLVGEKQPVAPSTHPTSPNSSQAQEPNRAVSLGKAERIVDWLRNGKQHWSIRVSVVALSAIALFVAGAAADLPLEGIAVVATSITIYAVIVWRRLAHQEAVAQQQSNIKSLVDQIQSLDGDVKPLLKAWDRLAI